MENNSNSTFAHYNLLIATRNYHYDNFIKWVKFFYIAMGVAFMAYMLLIVTESNINYTFEKTIVAIIGYVVSMACYLATKGHFYLHSKIIDLILSHENSKNRENTESTENKDGEGNTNKEASKDNKTSEKNNKKIYHYLLNVNDEGCSNYCVPWKKASFSIFKIMLMLTFIVIIAWGMLFIKSLGYLIESPYLTSMSVISMSIISIVVSFIIAFIAKKLKVDHKKDAQA